MSLLLDRVEEALAPPSGLLLYARSMSRITSRLRFIEPQLASPVDQPPEGKHWIHEVKHDGYCCQVLVEQGRARVFTRNGFDWSDCYPGIVRAASILKCKSAIIDGEATF
jgi:bifunctional non-homologous end joining protein LigD